MSKTIINGQLIVGQDAYILGDITGSADLNISGSILIQTTPTTGTSGDFLIYNSTTKQVETRVGGANGTSGTSGATGSSGNSGTNGANGSSGTSGID